MTVFEGDDCNDLTELVCAEEAYLPAFESTVGKTYFIAITIEFTTRYGDSAALTFAVTNTPHIPPSDECVNALVIPLITSFPFSTAPVQMQSATENQNDPVSSCAESSTPATTIDTVWYTWIPQTSGMYDFRTDKSTGIFNLGVPSTAIEIYNGNSCDSVTEVACTSQLSLSIRGVKLDAGTKYYV